MAAAEPPAPRPALPGGVDIFTYLRETLAKRIMMIDVRVAREARAWTRGE